MFTSWLHWQISFVVDTLRLNNYFWHHPDGRWYINRAVLLRALLFWLVQYPCGVLSSPCISTIDQDRLNESRLLSTALASGWRSKLQWVA